MSKPLGNAAKRSKYRILGLVGQGQFGRVFAAVHRQNGKLVALKSLEHARFPTHKFLRELRVLLSLQHPNIVTCESLEHTPTGRCLVMDYCEGGTLRTLMGEPQSASLPHSLKIITDILAGLDYAHCQGIVHCDIKPENILLTLQPAGWTARITDFGIARFRQESHLQSGSITGSPAYMAPERFYGQYFQSSDIYAVGVLLFELLSGRRPFSGTPAELMSAHLNRSVAFPETVPILWRPIISRALQKLSARRYRSAGEMLQAIQSIAAQTLPNESNPWQTFLSTAPLLLSPPNSTQQRFKFQTWDLVTQPIAHLATIPYIDSTTSQSSIPAKNQPNILLKATTHCLAITVQIPGQTESQAPDCELQFSFKHAIETILPRPQGYFIQTTQSLHFIPALSQEIPLAQSIHAQTIQPETIQTMPTSSLITLSPEGGWFASWTPTSNTTADLNFGKLPSLDCSRSIATRPIALPYAFTDLTQLIAIDARHLALITTQRSPDSKRSNTQIQIFSRRGSLVTTLSLAVRLGKITPTPIPYRLLAIDLDHPNLLLLLDLLPYRLTRLSTNLQPQLIMPTDWGIVLADKQSQIIFLDHIGNSIGQVNSPPHLTAIAAIAPHSLLLATWNGQQGNLYTSDLRELDIDVVF